MNEDAMFGLSQLTNGIAAAASAIGSAELGAKNRSFAARQAEIQREWSEEMWNKQFNTLKSYNRELQDYNSPVNQLKRLSFAGINPNSGALAVGNGSSLPTANPSPLSSSVPTPAGQSFSINPTTDLLDYRMRREQLRGMSIENDFKARGLELSQDEQAARIDEIRQTISKMQSDKRLTDENADILLRSAEFLVAKNEADSRLAVQEVDNALVRYREIEQTISNLRKQGVNIEQDTRAKQINNDYNEAYNQLKRSLIDIGIDPNVHGFDRFMDYILRSDDGQALFKKLTSFLSSDNDSFSTKVLKGISKFWRSDDRHSGAR